jgi:hypothetical protein
MAKNVILFFNTALTMQLRQIDIAVAVIPLSGIETALSRKPTNSDQSFVMIVCLVPIWFVDVFGSLLMIILSFL